MVNDPIGDMLIQIKNAACVGKRVVELSNSKLRLALAQILVSEGYLAQAAVKGEAPRAKLVLGLKYQKGQSVISEVKRMSKPGLRWYVNRDKIPQVVGGMGIAVLSTSEGLMTGVAARKRGIGGELICTIW